MTALIIVKRINYFSGPNTYLHVCGRGEVLLFLVTPKLYRVFHVGLILVLGDQIEKNLRVNYWSRNWKSAKSPVTKCTIIMSTVNSDDLGQRHVNHSPIDHPYTCHENTNHSRVPQLSKAPIPTSKWKYVPTLLQT